MIFNDSIGRGAYFMSLFLRFAVARNFAKTGRETKKGCLEIRAASLLFNGLFISTKIL